MCLALLGATLLLATQSSISVDRIIMKGSGQNIMDEWRSQCEVAALSRDGKRVVGSGTPLDKSIDWPFVWEEGKGIKILPVPEELKEESTFFGAEAISGDGKVIGGSALWANTNSPLYSKFKKTMIPLSELARVPVERMSARALNYDGSIIAVNVEHEEILTAFLWDTKEGRAKAVRSSSGKQIRGSVLEMSDNGEVMVGNENLNMQLHGFVITKGRFQKVKPLPGYETAGIECMTPDGLTAFGNLGPQLRAFTLDIRSNKVKELKKGFIVSCASDDGKVLGGWYHQQEPALLVNGKIRLIDDMTGWLGSQVHVMDVKRVGERVYVLLDGSVLPVDYRVTIPLSKLK